MVLTTIPHGTYNEMAAQYARWGGAQSWAASKLAEKRARNPLLEKIFTNGLIRVGWPPIAWGTACFQQDESGRYRYIENTEYARYEPYYDELLKYFADYERFYGIAPGYWLAVWNGDYFDTAYPNYFPVKPYMGDFDAFQRTASLRGLPLLYHMNIVHWPVFAPQAAQREYHASWQGGTYAYQKWSNVDHQLVNLGKSIEEELPTVRKLRDENGSGGVYLDVVGHAFVQDNSPENPFREAPNPYQLAKVKAFEQIRAILTGPVMTEGRSEIYLPSIDLAYGACGSTAIEDQIPLWEMVYGDCVATHPFNSMGGHRNMTMSMGGVFGLPWKWPEQAFRRLVARFEADGRRLTTGNIGTKYLLETFSHFGRSDLAYALAASEDYPGWGYMLKNGATTLWERWELADGYGMNSHNHPMLGSVGSWFFHYPAGIRLAADADGFRNIILSPHWIDALDWVKCRYDSAQGAIVSEWYRRNDLIDWVVEIPPNSRAEVILADACSATIGGAGEVRTGSFMLGSGKYQLRVSLHL